MEEISQNLQSASWWFTALVMGIVASLMATGIILLVKKIQYRYKENKINDLEKKEILKNFLSSGNYEHVRFQIINHGLRNSRMDSRSNKFLLLSLLIINIPAAMISAIELLGSGGFISSYTISTLVFTLFLILSFLKIQLSEFSSNQVNSEAYIQYLERYLKEESPEDSGLDKAVYKEME